MEGEKESTRGKFLWKRCRLALGQQAWLRKLAEAVVGRALTKDELVNFDPESLCGKQVDCMVTQSEKDDRIYVNVISFNKTVKPLESLADTEVKKTGQVIEKATVPVTAPDADSEADALINKVKGEQAELKATDDVEKLEAKLAAAKAKAAKATK